ncbi:MULTISPECIES: thiopurine S-methyltransferase [Pseudomonas]|jgi:thiopurine S-methyltransferase|uniref:Thiopurine S-methyltransferase n=1 Tax=Pseudomonas mosselii TaxID=78327 RepID=A0A5R8Z5K1_9PSED|nr:thiopurine S-methyltransferase [Pseudomonas mosselii]TLP61088.1 thiopurine S-methyltransferase [Pseudomonas mosselii]
MQAAFWHQRWADNQIGFHQAQVNPYLQTHWAGLALPPGAKVLVPLCGKSLDLVWLAGQGYQVMGVELSQHAIACFFAEHGLTPEVSRQGAFEVWRSDEVALWCGDIFSLRPEDVSECAALYDRAALIALPPDMRGRYLALLGDVLPEACKGLLVTLDYDQSLIGGPPFSVADEEVRQGFAGWQVETLAAPEIIGDSPKFQKAGVHSLVERAYRLQRGGAAR